MSMLTLNAKAPFSESVRKLLASYPLVAYFIFAFAGTWVFTAPMVLGQDGLGILPYHVPFGLYAMLFIASSFTGPTLAAVVVTAACHGQAGVKHFFRRYGQWRIGWPWSLLIFLGFPAIYFIAATFWMGSAPWQALPQRGSTFFTAYLPAMLIFPGFIQWGEEPGWRGFAQTHMQRQYGAWQASLVVGFLHGLWHLPNHLLISGPTAAGPFDPGNFALNTALTMALSIVFTWIFNGGKQSILVAVLTHASFNMASLWLSVLLPNQPAQVEYTALLILAVWAAVIMLLTKGKLGYVPSKDQSTQI